MLIKAFQKIFHFYLFFFKFVKTSLSKIMFERLACVNQILTAKYISDSTNIFVLCYYSPKIHSCHNNDFD